MKVQAQQMEVENLQENLIQEWYQVSREMNMFIPITFPYFTFQGFIKAAIRESENNGQSTNTFGSSGKNKIPNTMGG